MFAMRFPRKSEGRPGSSPQWLTLIHLANGETPGMFGEPTLVKDVPLSGDYCEQYEDANVFFPVDDPLTVLVSARTKLGDLVLRRAFHRMAGGAK